MSFHKWMPAGQDASQALLNADKLGCSWGLHTALWRLLHPLTYNNKEQRAVFAAAGEYIATAAAALALPNSGEGGGAGSVLASEAELGSLRAAVCLHARRACVPLAGPLTSRLPLPLTVTNCPLPLQTRR